MYSRRESLLSRRSCRSISSLILRASLASGLRQQAPTELRVIPPGSKLPLLRHIHTHMLLLMQRGDPSNHPDPTRPPSPPLPEKVNLSKDLNPCVKVLTETQKGSKVCSCSDGSLHYLGPPSSDGEIEFVQHNYCGAPRGASLLSPPPPPQQARSGFAALPGVVAAAAAVDGIWRSFTSERSRK